MKNPNPVMKALVKGKSSKMSKNFNHSNVSGITSTNANHINTNKGNLFPSHLLDPESKSKLYNLNLILEDHLVLKTNIEGELNQTSPTPFNMESKAIQDMFELSKKSNSITARNNEKSMDKAIYASIENSAIKNELKVRKQLYTQNKNITKNKGISR